MSVNKVFLVGHAGKDPDLRYTPSGAAVATFSMATTERYKDKDGNVQEKTEWHNIVVWRQSAEFVGKYLTKGRQIYVEGKIQTRSYDDRDGNKRYITEIVANQVQLLGKADDYQKPADRQDQRPAQQPQGGGVGGFGGGGYNEEPPFNAEDDIPFALMPHWKEKFI